MVAGSQSHGNCGQKAESDECTGKQVLSHLKIYTYLFLYVMHMSVLLACMCVCVCVNKGTHRGQNSIRPSETGLHCEPPRDTGN